MICGLWFGVCALWFVVWGLWFGVCDLWFVVCGLGFVVCGLRFRAQCQGFHFGFMHHTETKLFLVFESSVQYR